MSLDTKALRRLHFAFVALVFALGFTALVSAVWELNTASPGPDWYVDVDMRWPKWILLASLVFLSSQFAIKVPALAATLSISETFIFSILLMFGTAPAVVTIAVDGLLVSLIRKHRNPKHVAFNMAEPALSMTVAGLAYTAMAQVPPLALAPPEVGMAQVGVPAMVLCLVYFVMNSGLNTIAMTSETGASPITIWRKYFLWVSINYAVAASFALLLSVNVHGMNTPLLLAVAAPLVVVSYYMFKSSMGRLEDENTHLAEVNRLYLKVVETLAMAVDAKDQVTHGHICRVQTYALTLARRLDVTDPKEIQAIEAAALLHDMGKLAIPEHILNKPGKLTSDEFERMKLHAPLGAEMLSAVDFPYPVVPIVRHHHENWDGSGYPDRLAGDAIPIGARILSVVDCYDALRSHRPYRRSLSPDQAFEIINERRGTMYDPTVVDAFKSIQDRIEAEGVDEPLPAVLDQFSQVAPQAATRTDLPANTAPLELRLFATDGLLRLYEHISSLGPEASVEDTCDVVSRYMRRLAPAGLVVFFRRQGVNDELVVIHASGFGEALVPNLVIPVGHGISGWVVANRRSIINADPALDVEARFDALSPRFRSALSVPLTPGVDTTGAVTLYSSQPNAFSEEQRMALELISGAIAEAVERAYQRTAKAGPFPASAEAIVAGSLAMDAILDRDVFWRGTTGRNLGVLCVRTDAGSGAMDHASVAVSQSTRVADLIFRPTDDELVVLMPDCDPGAGQIIVDRIGTLLPSTLAPDGAPMPVHVAFSCGPHDGTTVRRLVDVARQRLDTRPGAPDDTSPDAGVLVPVAQRSSDGV